MSNSRNEANGNFALTWNTSGEMLGGRERPEPVRGAKCIEPPRSTACKPNIAVFLAPSSSSESASGVASESKAADNRRWTQILVRRVHLQDNDRRSSAFISGFYPTLPYPALPRPAHSCRFGTRQKSGIASDRMPSTTRHQPRWAESSRVGGWSVPRNSTRTAIRIQVGVVRSTMTRYAM